MTNEYNDKSEKSYKKEDLSKLLPDKNCGMCGYARCDEFAGALLKKHANLDKCRVIYYKMFEENLKELESILEEKEEDEIKEKNGKIDSKEGKALAF